jgi:hypothetical protein
MSNRAQSQVKVPGAMMVLSVLSFGVAGVIHGVVA